MSPAKTTYLELEDILNTIKLLLEPVEHRMSAIEPFRRLLRSCASRLEFAWLFFLSHTTIFQVVYASLRSRNRGNIWNWGKRKAVPSSELLEGLLGVLATSATRNGRAEGSRSVKRQGRGAGDGAEGGAAGSCA